MSRKHTSGLGLIPAWQFSPDPRINSNLNPNVVSFAPDSAALPIAGTRLLPTAPPPGLGIEWPIIDSWWWKHRKALAVGGAVLVGATALSIVSSILR